MVNECLRDIKRVSCECVWCAGSEQLGAFNPPTVMIWAPLRCPDKEDGVDRVLLVVNGC